MKLMQVCGWFDVDRPKHVEWLGEVPRVAVFDIAQYLGQEHVLKLKGTFKGNVTALRCAIGFELSRVMEVADSEGFELLVIVSTTDEYSDMSSLFPIDFKKCISHTSEEVLQKYYESLVSAGKAQGTQYWQTAPIVPTSTDILLEQTKLMDRCKSMNYAPTTTKELMDEILNLINVEK